MRPERVFVPRSKHGSHICVWRPRGGIATYTKQHPHPSVANPASLVGIHPPPARLRAYALILPTDFPSSGKPDPQGGSELEGLKVEGVAPHPASPPQSPAFAVIGFSSGWGTIPRRKRCIPGDWRRGDNGKGDSGSGGAVCAPRIGKRSLPFLGVGRHRKGVVT